MLNKVLKAIERFSLFENSKTVTVALSGGADSVSLLYALLEIKDSLGLTVRAAHLNHQLRGEESLRDEQFVKELCERLEVELVIKRADVSAEAEKTGESIELAARRIRYDFLEKAGKGSLVATAHTASDSAETVIFNLARGTALKGLMGIPAKRGMFIRPLILASRQEIENYCAEKGISFVTDSTNLGDDYTRNRIRHNIVPVLKDINASFENTVLRMGAILAEDNDYLESKAKEVYNNVRVDKSVKTEPLMAEHPAVSKRVIRIYLSDMGIEASAVNTEEVLSILGGGKTVMPNNITLKSEKGLLFIEEKTESKDFITEYKLISRKEFEKINNLLLKNVLDYDKICGKLVLRKKESGDKMRQAGRGNTKTLKKLCTEQKVDLSLRENLPVLADDKGVIWAYGFGVAERVKTDNETNKFLVIKSEIK